MNERENGDKIIPFRRGVEQTTFKRDDGSVETVEGSYTMYLESGAIVSLFGVNRATAEEYKRVADNGFTEAEVKRMRNNGPFSTDPSVDCDRIVSTIEAYEEMMIKDIQWFLQRLLHLITTRRRLNPENPLDSKDHQLKIIGNLAEMIRLYKNFELAEKLKLFRLSGNKKKDKKYINEIIDMIKARSIKKFPE